MLIIYFRSYCCGLIYVFTVWVYLYMQWFDSSLPPTGPRPRLQLWTASTLIETWPCPLVFSLLWPNIIYCGLWLYGMQSVTGEGWQIGWGSCFHCLCSQEAKKCESWYSIYTPSTWNPRPQFTGQCHGHLRWIFPLPLNPLWEHCLDTHGGVSPGWLQVQSSWQGR